MKVASDSSAVHSISVPPHETATATRVLDRSLLSWFCPARPRYDCDRAARPQHSIHNTGCAAREEEEEGEMHSQITRNY
jgi:hypothetical protein